MHTVKEEMYRTCAATVLFRTNGDTIEVLLLHKPRKKDAWQFPQGGVEEGESITEAALRELQEEAGITATPLGVSDTTYQYDFPASYRRFRPDHICGQRVHFTFARCNGEEVNVDDEEIDDHVWVTADQIQKYIKRKEYLQIAQNVYKEGLALL